MSVEIFIKLYLQRERDSVFNFKFFFLNDQTDFVRNLNSHWVGKFKFK